MAASHSFFGHNNFLMAATASLCCGTTPCSKLYRNSSSVSQFNSLKGPTRSVNSRVKCESKEQPLSSSEPKNSTTKLQVGSPVVVIEAPKMIKTAASVPSLRVNSGLVNPGDVGRIVSRKPKDVWAVRLAIGTYLIDGRYFKPLELDE